MEEVEGTLSTERKAFTAKEVGIRHSLEGLVTCKLQFHSTRAVQVFLPCAYPSRKDFPLASHQTDFHGKDRTAWNNFCMQCFLLWSPKTT